jgi:hypothetical protein
MTSDKLFSVADRLAGFAERNEPLEPAMTALCASIIRDCAEMLAGMEACALVPEVAAELVDMIEKQHAA